MIQKTTKKLHELAATAICGNDISSSCLYVSALSILYAGQYAWISLLMVSAVLFLFRSIYGEVVGALPLNGGAYNALLNTTSKRTAAFAAYLTILSYMATAVISANEAANYIHSLLPATPVMLVAVGILMIFMFLVIRGIGESSKVALIIFILHLVSLSLLVILGGVYIATHGLDVLAANKSLPVHGSIWMALFFGFSASMLGISGFESSANFVEEQQVGVFPKTLRNMWIVVTIFNPLMAFLALAILPISEISAHPEAVLSILGLKSGGVFMSTLISIDAALVLSGAVLTAYVGVSGLLNRITLDRIMPNFFLKKNRYNSTYVIHVFFFLLCCSILFVTAGELTALAGVYTISFLSVMILFVVGNIFLKLRRRALPRPESASVFALFIGIAGVGLAIIGNIVLNPNYFYLFIEYLIPTMLIGFIMLNRTLVLKALLYVIKYIFSPIQQFVTRISDSILQLIKQINDQQFVFFTAEDDVAVLNKVMLYLSQNEHTNKLKIVTVLEADKTVPDKLISDIEVLDREYPEIDIEFVQLKGHFGPVLIKQLSKEWDIPINFMFIGSPSGQFPYRVEDLGGVRLII